MHEFQWDIMKNFLETGNFGYYELYRNLTMSDELFDQKYPTYEETEERSQ